MRYLLDVIHRSQVSRRYLHGDFNPPNIIADIESGSMKITLIDPLITKDPPEANWRFFTEDPPLAEHLALEYGSKHGQQPDAQTMYAIGALTHLFLSITRANVDPNYAFSRRSALDTCIAKLQTI
jgi:hypothetical protein